MAQDQFQNLHIEHVRRDFTDAEMARFASDIARLDKEIEQHEEEADQAKKHFASLVKEKANERREISKRALMGYEETPTPCDVFYDQPTPGMKTLMNAKTFKIEKVLPMLPNERQRSFMDDRELPPEAHS